MPAQNVTIDDASALIQYIAPDGKQWVDSPTKDQELPKYRDHTYHSSNLYGAWAAIRFEGTAIYLYAAKRSRHGTYNIILDGQLVFQGNGYAALPSYDEVMFSTTGLSPGWHNLTCANSDPTNQTYTEVDYITWTTSMQDSLTESTGAIIPYTPGAMAYSSLDAWKEDLTDSTPYMTTSSDGASVDITFDGNGISLYGVTGPSYGTFSAKIDGYDSHELSAFSGQAHNALLFRQDNLPNGKHTLTVTNRGTSLFSVASAVPLLWTDPNQQSSSISSGIIAGSIVAAVTGLALIAFLLLWILRRRRRTSGQDIRVHSIHEPAFIDATPFVLPVSPGAQSSHIQSPATAQHSKHGSDSSQHATYPLHYHTVPGSPGMSSRGSFDAPQSSAGIGAPSSNAGGSSSGWAPAPAGAWGAARPSSKGRPSSASTSRAEIPENVEVLRESDAGPIILPPAYSASFASPTQTGHPAIASPAPGTESSLAPVGSVTPSPRPSTSTVPSPLIPVSALSVSNTILVEGASNDHLSHQAHVPGNEHSHYTT